ncbi:hypothetical protein F5J12DRAFT_434409 [Pisolithus orientalis]|uniref:uncharacterized protein n=1 Tax=Pisolithus orientalis TaxID=936130 RepID=UPI0022255094|nr:uncharacterized protein F5J12DRAFT_434409 [Pisolithus orientalis]KAI5993108.1 hypothetical protein F5J12DRAFT_434409 [Pisolithus orientalis]
MDVEVSTTPGIGAENRAEADLAALYQEKDKQAPTEHPFPALTRPSSQTPQLGSFKHLFSKPKYDVGAATPAMQSMHHLFEGVPISCEGIQMPSMDRVKTFLKEEGRGRAGDGTPAMEGVKQMMGTPVAWQQQESSGKESYERDDGNDKTVTEQGHAAVPQTITTRHRTSRLNANSGTVTTEGTTVLKLEEVPTDDVLSSPATEVPEAAPSKTKPLRVREQTCKQRAASCVLLRGLVFILFPFPFFTLS